LRSAAKAASAQRRAKGAASGARGPISAKRAQVKKVRAEKGAEAAIALAKKVAL
jgi:hypothetical protein